MAKRLEMTFKDSANKNMKLTVNDVKENITEPEVSAAMQTILSKGIFETAAGALISAEEAKLVEINETEIKVK